MKEVNLTQFAVIPALPSTHCADRRPILISTVADDVGSTCVYDG